MSLSTVTGVTMIDTRAGTGAMTLPLTTDVPYRVITVKDIYGALALSSITLVTQGSDVFESGLSTMTLTNVYETTTLYAGQSGYWYIIGGSRMAGASIGTLSTGVIQNPLRIGTLSSLNTIQFPGIASNYTGTIIAEQTTGVGTQELLLFKASSISDQIRLQTTGNIVFEAGASGRTWPNAPALATPTLYIAGTTSNIGIGTATPQTTLDVVGTTRSQTLSSFTLTVSSINGTAPWQPSFLLSTVQGLGTASYISSSQLFSTVASLTSNISTMIDTTELTSTVVGLGTFGFISTVGLTYAIASTAQGLGTFGYTSTNQLLSTTIGIYAAITTGINVAVQPQFISTVQGLGTAGYISSSQLTSTVQGLGSGFTGSTTYLSAAVINVSTLNTYYLSTTFAYISSLQVGTLNVGGASGYVNIQDLIVSTVSAGQITASQSFFSSLQVNTISFGTGSNVILPNILATSVSTIQVNTNSAYVNNLYIGNNSTQSALLFPGINNSYKNSAVAEQNTGVGTQELLFFRGSSISDQIRLQTTGNIVFETGVSARTWSTNTMAATPTLYIQGTTSNIGIGTNAPGATLDVVGTARAITVSTVALNVSSINGTTLFQQSYLISSIDGLGTLGYISSSQLTSTVAGLGTVGGGASQPSITSTITGLGTFGYISSSQLTSTVAGLGTGGGVTQPYITSTIIGLGTFGYISSSQLTSTVAGLATEGAGQPYITSTITGLGTFGYISSSQLTSTVASLTSNISSMIDPTELTSTIVGLGTFGFISTIGLTYAIASTAQGLGTLGYTSTSQLLSTTIGVYAAITTSINTAVEPEFISTVKGLGSSGYISTSQLTSTVTGIATGSIEQPYLTSTVIGLGSLGYISSSQLQNYFSSFSTSLAVNFITSSLTASSISALDGFVSSLTVNSLTFGNNTGYISFGDIVPTSVSTLILYTGQEYATSIVASSIQTGSLYLSTDRLFMSSGSLSLNGSTILYQTSLQSTVLGLGTLGYISSSQLQSTVSGVGSITQSYLTSTTTGLGTIGYISSSQLTSTVAGLTSNISSMIDTTELTSTIVGLGTFGFISTFGLTYAIASTAQGLGTFGYTSTSQLLSTTVGVYAAITTSINTAVEPGFISTVAGLGTAGYISSSQLTSTVQGLGTGGASQPSITSTITGLGTFGYISSSQLTSTVASFNTLISNTGGGGISLYNLTSTVTGLTSVFRVNVFDI